MTKRRKERGNGRELCSPTARTSRKDKQRLRPGVTKSRRVSQGE